MSYISLAFCFARRTNQTFTLKSRVSSPRWMFLLQRWAVVCSSSSSNVLDWITASTLSPHQHSRQLVFVPYVTSDFKILPVLRHPLYCKKKKFVSALWGIKSLAFTVMYCIWSRARRRSVCFHRRLHCGFIFHLMFTCYSAVEFRLRFTKWKQPELTATNYNKCSF